jgi:hypothetical protein
MQNHKFVRSEDHQGKCIAISDDGVTICFEDLNQHKPVIFTEINPYLDSEKDNLRKNLCQDIQACLTFARQKKAWSNDRSLTLSARQEHARQAQVWEARAEALRMALNGLAGHPGR